MKVIDHGLPLHYLRQERHRLVEQLGQEHPPTKLELSEIADLQQVISAVEAVIIEKDNGSFG